jgi:ribosomal protein S18 acetylase RimI-like enzyme
MRMGLMMRPFATVTDRETVLEWLLEAVEIGSDEPADAREQSKHYFPALERAQARDPRFCSIAEEDGRAVGLVDQFPMPKRPDTAFMRFLYVVPDMRGTGLAGRLLYWGDRLMMEFGCSSVLLDVREGNVRALAFYRKHGWNPVERRKGGFLRMSREIPDQSDKEAAAEWRSYPTGTEEA